MNTLQVKAVPSDCSGEILHWDLEKVKIKLAQKGHPRESIEQLETEYKRYLMLVVRYSTHLPISGPVDEMWHTHILFTRDYERLGKAVGGFIHHEPVITKSRQKSLLANYQKTLSLYEKHWGVPDPIYWPNNNCVCDPGGEGTDDTGGQLPPDISPNP